MVNNDDDIAKFHDLELENNDDDGGKNLTDFLTYLGGKLSPEDFAEAKEKLGITDEMSNAELYQKLMKAMKPDEEKKEDDEEDMGSYKDFMTKCMKGGKDLKECGDEWKEKKPDASPTDAEIAEVTTLAEGLKAADDEDKKEKKDDEYPEPVKKALEEMQNRIDELEAINKEGAVRAQVTELKNSDHISPKQLESVIKLAADLPEGKRAELYAVFQGQKFTVKEDVGQTESNKAGAVELSPEVKERLMREHGLNELIASKAVNRGVNN